MSRQTPRRDTLRPNPAKGPTRRQRRQRELEREEPKRQTELERERRQEALIEQCEQKANEAASVLSMMTEIINTRPTSRNEKCMHERALQEIKLARTEFLNAIRTEDYSEKSRYYLRSLKLFESVIGLANGVIKANEANSFSVPGNQLGTPSPLAPSAACAQDHSPRARASQDQQTPDMWYSPSTRKDPNKNKMLSSALGQPSVW